MAIKWIAGSAEDIPIDNDRWTPQEAANMIEAFEMVCADCHGRITIHHLRDEGTTLKVYLNPHECGQNDTE